MYLFAVAMFVPKGLCIYCVCYFSKAVIQYQAAEMLPKEKITIRTLLANYDYNKFESFSFFICILYLTFIWMRGPSCDFVYHLIKFNEWQKGKTDRSVFEWPFKSYLQVSLKIIKWKFVEFLDMLFFPKMVLHDLW